VPVACAAVLCGARLLYSPKEASLRRADARSAWLAAIMRFPAQRSFA